MKRRIVVGLDGSVGAAAALDWCLRNAPLLDAEIVAVHVLQFGPEYFVPATLAAMQPSIEDVRTAHRALLEEWVEGLRGGGIEIRTMLADGRPASVLDKIAIEEDADMIVVGRRAGGGFPELVLGSVSHALAHHAHRPVLVVPTAPESGK